MNTKDKICENCQFGKAINAPAFYQCDKTKVFKFFNDTCMRFQVKEQGFIDFFKNMIKKGN